MDTSTATITRNKINSKTSDWWLTVDGVVVCYARTYSKFWNNSEHENLCDIETREGHRNNGYAKKILAMIAEDRNVDRVSHRGSYTPDGFNFLYATGLVGDHSDPVDGPSYKPMNFVRDWDSMSPIYPD